MNPDFLVIGAGVAGMRAAIELAIELAIKKRKKAEAERAITRS